MRAAGVVRVVEAGKAFRACSPRRSWDGTHLAVRWWPVREGMCMSMGKHLNSACGEMFTLCTAIHRRQTLTRQHRAVAHSDHGVQSRSAGCGAEAKLYRACTSSSLISISPPPSWLGWSSGTTAGLSFASSSCRRLSRACPVWLACCCTNTRPAQSRHHPNTLLASDDTSLHLHTTPISHILLRFCH